ncbi:dephospho-CoA kinase [Roseofilum reptotaenium CS-1145]|uniref:Dephospho-CoA kinase n=1 Tax=Roseofilum reptotaenium AO1-A TaxID=1925591 RepID=A0A1L9QUC9_9CYAN|nr:dephospho-CoA kinase [Roseofilum reptotaenium]MDB9517750.1 dephospho-CoA kinase [Roseofilum reptotaenium CS-1145]OJJ26305.1 dephospho-CoA kinase [Roseofilum reptotaenium AO1-A]
MSQKQAQIGITGGIATGKSTVTGYLEQRYGLPVFDADRYAREAVQPKSPIFQRIVQRYGKTIELPGGGLNRQQLGEIVFSNPVERQWLEEQIHPYVRDRLYHDLNQSSPQDTLVFSIPLLFEAQMTDLVEEIWVVYCSEAQQIERLMRRNHLTLEQAQMRINSQMPLAEKCQRGDRLLDNSSTESELFQQIDRILQSNF